MLSIHRILIYGIASLNFGFLNHAFADQVDWNTPSLAPLVSFFKEKNITRAQWPELTFVKKEEIPQQYQFLLTQRLMTGGVADYYQRTPKIRKPLYANYDSNQKTFTRAIIMIIDQDSKRNDALQADQLGEATSVELGLIIMNFSALPSGVIEGVLHSQIPFGALLVQYHVSTHSSNISYLKLKESILNTYLDTPNSVLYGRTNSLFRDDNGQWVASVVEILTGAPRSSQP